MTPAPPKKDTLADQPTVDAALLELTPERLAALNPLYGEAVALSAERNVGLDVAVGVLILAELRTLNAASAVPKPRPRRTENDNG